LISRTILLFFLCSFCVGFCQNENLISSILKSDTPIEEKINTIDSIATLYHNKNKRELLDALYEEYSTWLYKHKKYDRTIKVLTASLKNQNNLPVIDTLLWQHRLYFLGISYRRVKQYRKSIEIFQHPVIGYRSNSKTAKSYSELGRCYKTIGDYYKAITYYQLGASLLSQQGNNKFLLINYINTTRAFLELKTAAGYQQSIHYFLKADSLSNKISANDSYNYYIKKGLGKSYSQRETLNIPKATSYYKEALNIAIKINDSSRIFNVYNQLGNLYNISDPNKGITYLNKAAPYAINNALNSFYNEINLGYCYLIKGMHDQSITSYMQGISHITKIDTEMLEARWNPSLFYNVEDKTPLLSVLKNLAKAYYQKYSISKDTAQLHRAIKTYTIADELLDIIQIESTELKSKLHWRKQSSELYGRATQACFLTNNKEKAFYFMEKSKALLLTEELKNVKLKKYNALPAAITKRETALKKKIYILEKQKQANPNKDSIAIELLKEQNQLIRLQDSIKKEFADFEVINTSNIITNFKEVQESLDSDEIAITYHISAYDDTGLITQDNNYKAVVKGSKYGTATKNSSYGMAITKNDIHFFELGNPAQLKKQVIALSKKMAAPLQSDSEIASYNELSHQVFLNLFPSKEMRNHIKNKKLLVIPDNYLNYISFEALTTTNTLKDPIYLIKETEIRYAYSNSFLKAIHPYTHASEISFLGFAPNQLANYQIIHLATHADAQDSISPWIAFRKNKLLLEELYFADNKSKMVVLSGCKTQLGKQEIGEGVMSLARGFFHSGAESVVSSLWDVQDTSTSYIMNEFYKNLHANQTKSEALRNAKLTYLETHMLSQVSPAYWASFVLLGNNNSLFEEQTLELWWLLILPVFLLVFFVYKKRTKK